MEKLASTHTRTRTHATQNWFAFQLVYAERDYSDATMCYGLSMLLVRVLRGRYFGFEFDTKRMSDSDKLKCQFKVKGLTIKLIIHFESSLSDYRIVILRNVDRRHQISLDTSMVAAVIKRTANEYHESLNTWVISFVDLTSMTSNDESNSNLNRKTKIQSYPAQTKRSIIQLQSTRACNHRACVSRYIWWISKRFGSINLPAYFINCNLFRFFFFCFGAKCNCRSHSWE